MRIFSLQRTLFRCSTYLLLPLLLIGLGQPCARADDLLPPDRSIPEAIDHYVDAKLTEKGLQAAPQADDAEFIRRVTLDLVGRIPTAGELETYLASDPDKRTRLVERLLNSPGFIRHQVTEFDAMLMEGTRGSIRDYLTIAFQENRPWDQMFRDLLLPNQKEPVGEKAREFLRNRVGDLDLMTNEISVLFFGVNVTCAKCHDHPLVDDWKQDHFYGMKSFLSRTFDNGGYLAEREYGKVTFKTRGGEQRTAKLMFLSGKTVDTPTLRSPSKAEEKKDKARFEELKKRKQVPPQPSFSARGTLVNLALQPGERDFFARSIVNRLWHRFFGLGLVNPIDQMHSANPPTHPRLLDWLARDLIAHHYDLRRLICGIVLSKTYGRTSQWLGDDRPRERYFAVAQVRPLTPMQLAVSLRLASTAPKQLSADLKPEEFEKRIEQLEASARGFASEIERPTDDFLISVDEALLFSNSERVQQEFLSAGRDRLLGQLKETRDRKQAIELAIRNVLSRPATAEEISILDDYLSAHQDRLGEAYQHVVWALLASSEFRFNH
jgi:hypothetical protein